MILKKIYSFLIMYITMFILNDMNDYMQLNNGLMIFKKNVKKNT